MSDLEEIINDLHSLVDEKNVCWKYTPSEHAVCGKILDLLKTYNNLGV